MAIKPKKPCHVPGCKELTAGKYCVKHEGMDKHRDKERGSAHSRGYDGRWKKIRKMVLLSEPLCRRCAINHKVVIATDVHHKDGDSKNNNISNLEPLCHVCHSGNTSKYQGWGNKNK